MAEDLNHSAAPAWSSASFQYGKGENSVVGYEGLKELLNRSRKRPSIGNLSTLGVSIGMRTHRLHDDLISRHAHDASDSEDSEWSDEESYTSGSAVEGSDGEASTAVSQSQSESESEDRHASVRSAPTGVRSPLVSRTHSKRSSLSSSKKSRSSQKPPIRRAAHKAASVVNSHTPSSPREDFDSTLIDFTSPQSPSPQKRPGSPQGHPSTAQRDLLDTKDNNLPHHLCRRNSGARFSSSPVPVTRVATDEGPGPSIMFVEEPRPLRQIRPTSAANGSLPPLSTPTSAPAPASASASAAAAANGSIPLSFNDLPCRGQHLILNELITQQSEDTAVIFTTLPAPAEGTHKGEGESLAYVSDLEVLCGGLPPTLMVHSNSMTVTMNL